MFVKLKKSELVYVASDIDSNKYLVRDLEDKNKAANLLARLKKNIDFLVEHLVTNRNKNIDMSEAIDQLEYRINGVIISESSPDSEYTSYSVNKGEEIVYCLRSRENNSLHALNLMMYVTLHELAHVGCKEIDHTPLFKKIFAFFTQTAIDIGLYQKIDFANEPKVYCGLTITDSIV